MSRSDQVALNQRIRKIVEELEKGWTSAEIIDNYTAQWNASDRTIKRYIALAKDIVMDGLKEADSVIEAVRGAVIAEEAEQNLRSNLELEAKLISIMEGELDLEKVISKLDGNTEIRSKASRREIIKIIEILWKKRGVFQKQKDVSVPDKKMVPGLPPIIVQNEEQRKMVEKVFNMP